ncbi:MAG: hypothetical protein AAFR81_14245 [Chloroflexota bacterium]
MSFGIHKPKWCPAFCIADSLNIGALSFGAIHIGCVTGFGLTHITEGNMAGACQRIFA